MGLGFRVWGLGFRVYGFRVKGLGFRKCAKPRLGAESPSSRIGFRV